MHVGLVREWPAGEGEQFALPVGSVGVRVTTAVEVVGGVAVIATWRLRREDACDHRCQRVGDPLVGRLDAIQHSVGHSAGVVVDGVDHLVGELLQLGCQLLGLRLVGREVGSDCCTSRQRQSETHEKRCLFGHDPSFSRALSDDKD